MSLEDFGPWWEQPVFVLASAIRLSSPQKHKIPQILSDTVMIGHSVVATKWIKLCEVPRLVLGSYQDHNCQKCHVTVVQITQKGILAFGLVKEGADSKAEPK